MLLDLSRISIGLLIPIGNFKNMDYAAFSEEYGFCGGIILFKSTGAYSRKMGLSILGSQYCSKDFVWENCCRYGVVGRY